MKILKKILILLSVFTILLIISFLIFPVIPGTIVLNTAKSYSLYDFKWETAKLYLSGNLEIQNIESEFNGKIFKCSKINIIFQPSQLLDKKKNIFYSIKKLECITENKEIIKSDFSGSLLLNDEKITDLSLNVKLSGKKDDTVLKTVSPCMVNYSSGNLKFLNGGIEINTAAPEFNIRIPVNKINGEFDTFNNKNNFSFLFSGALVKGNLEFINDKIKLNIHGKNLDLSSFFMMNRYIPGRVMTIVKDFSGEFEHSNDVLKGKIDFDTLKGVLLSVEETEPVQIVKTSFGNIPEQLGLTPDKASDFNKISGDIIINTEERNVINLDIFSPHYKLNLNGFIDGEQNVDAKLKLSLVQETLKGNTLNCDFSNLDGEETFNIYGHFTGKLPDPLTIWDLDKQKLLESAAKGLKNNIRKKMNNYFKIF